MICRLKLTRLSCNTPPPLHHPLKPSLLSLCSTMYVTLQFLPRISWYIVFYVCIGRHFAGTIVHPRPGDNAISWQPAAAAACLSSCCSRRHARKLKSKHNTTAATDKSDNTNTTSVTSTWYITKYKFYYCTIIVVKLFVVVVVIAPLLAAVACSTTALPAQCTAALDNRHSNHSAFDTIRQSSLFTRQATAFYISTH